MQDRMHIKMRIKVSNNLMNIQLDEHSTGIGVKFYQILYPTLFRLLWRTTVHSGNVFAAAARILMKLD